MNIHNDLITFDLRMMKYIIIFSFILFPSLLVKSQQDSTIYFLLKNPWLCTNHTAEENFLKSDTLKFISERKWIINSSKLWFHKDSVLGISSVTLDSVGTAGELGKWFISKNKSNSSLTELSVTRNPIYAPNELIIFFILYVDDKTLTLLRKK